MDMLWWSNWKEMQKVLGNTPFTTFFEVQPWKYINCQIITDPKQTNKQQQQKTFHMIGLM